MVDIRVLRGSPSDEELAALVTVLAALAAQSTVDAPEPEPPAWASVPLPRAPVSTWRLSGLPQ